MNKFIFLTLMSLFYANMSFAYDAVTSCGEIDSANTLLENSAIVDCDAIESITAVLLADNAVTKAKQLRSRAIVSAIRTNYAATVYYAGVVGNTSDAKTYWDMGESFDRNRSIQEEFRKILIEIDEEFFNEFMLMMEK